MKSHSFPGQLTIAAMTVCVIWLASPFLLGADESKKTPTAPSEDRVGFPRGYQEKFQVLRVVNKEKERKVVTVYGNGPAASVTNALQLPYPYGSIIVMETAGALQDASGKPLFDEKGGLRKDTVLGLHVMRREKNLGKTYGENRTGEWEYVEYRADGSYITPPQKSATCAACHVKAGAKRDFVYQGGLGLRAETK